MNRTEARDTLVNALVEDFCNTLMNDIETRTAVARSGFKGFGYRSDPDLLQCAVDYGVSDSNVQAMVVLGYRDVDICDWLGVPSADFCMNGQFDEGKLAPGFVDALRARYYADTFMVQVGV